jgi:hypothetical protein
VTSDFAVEHYADFGTGEPWVARLMIGLPELVQPFFPEQHGAFMGALGELFDALGKAFEALRQVQDLNGKPAAKLTTENLYETFYGHLWRAYKDRFPPVMSELGLDIGFIFQKDAPFEKRAADLLEERPELEDLVALMHADRLEFQNGLGAYRNLHLEHRQHPVDQRALAAFHRADSATTMFENVWEAIEDYVALYTKAHMPPSIQLVEIEEPDRDPERPTRFQFVLNLPHP